MTSGPTDRSAEAAPSFTRIAPYYDELMKDVPYRAWVRFVLALAERHGSRPDRILDLACGTGTVALTLAQNGYEVVGVDGSEAMLAVARQKAAAAGLDVPFLHSDLASFTAPGAFDLVLCLYDSLNNILEADRLEQAFARAGAALAPEGLFIFDMNTEYALRANLFTQENRDPEAIVQYDWQSRYDYQTRICSVEMEFWVRTTRGREHFRELHLQRAYSLPELERLLKDAGLDLLAAYDGLSFRAPQSRTDRLYCVTRLQRGDSDAP